MKPLFRKANWSRHFPAVGPTYLERQRQLRIGAQRFAEVLAFAQVFRVAQTRTFFQYGSGEQLERSAE